MRLDLEESRHQLEPVWGLAPILRTSKDVVPSNAGLPQGDLPNWISQPSVWPEA